MKIGQITASSPEATSLIFHYRPGRLPKINKEIFTIMQDGHWIWASQWCLQKATDTLLSWKIDKLKSLFCRCSLWGQAALRGTVFESIAHRLIANQGCTGNFRYLEENAAKDRVEDVSPSKHKRTNASGRSIAVVQRRFRPYVRNFFKQLKRSYQNDTTLPYLKLSKQSTLSSPPKSIYFR